MKNKAKLLAYPYVVWIAIFIIVPLVLVLVYSFTEEYSQSIIIDILAESYDKFFNILYLNILWKSFKLAFISTFLCLILGYPVALIISKAKAKYKAYYYCFLVPIWMNFLLRTYAWMAILSPNGFINRLLQLIGLPTLAIMPGQTAVVIGMVYNFLPFMVLPIYTVLSKDR